MDVQASAAGGGQHRFGQDQAVGGDDGGVQLEGGERPVFGGVLAQPCGGTHRKGQVIGRDVDGAALDGVAPAGGTGRLAVDRRDRVAGRVQRLQSGNREIRAAHEGEAHGRSQRPSRFCRCSFASRRRIMFRFSAERWSTNRTPSRWSISCCRQAASRLSPSISRRAPVSSR